MTKKEFIDFLEPFSDEIIIVKYNEEFRFRDNGLESILPKYKIAKDTNKKLGINYQDGIIVIE